MTLQDILCRYYPLTDNTLQRLEEIVCERIYKKKEIIGIPNKKFDQFLLMESGLIRVFFEREDKETTLAFGIAGDIIASLHYIYAKSPSPVGVMALEDTKVFAFKYDELDKLSATYPELHILFRKIWEEQSFCYEFRSSFMAITDVYTAYDQFLRMRPELRNRIPQRYLAQYLNCTPETLSRIRNKWSRNQHEPLTSSKGGRKEPGFYITHK